MNKALMDKLKEALISVLPVIGIVLVVSFTPLVSFTMKELGVFVLCAIFLIIGIGLFNLGADMAMTPMGEYMGTGLTRTRNWKILFSVSFFMGLLITIAEPDLSVLAEQVSAMMNETLLIVTVGVGVGFFLLIAVMRIVFKKELSFLLMLFYMLLFALCALLIESGNGGMIPLSYDSGGVTTGPITVPFIMALGVGIATTVGGREESENSFGLIALCSVGPMLAVLALSLLFTGNLNYTMSDYSIEAALSEGLLRVINVKVYEVVKALILIVIFFFLINKFVLKMPRTRLIPIIIGIAYTFIGLVVFLTSVTVGFMPIGFRLGTQLSQHGAGFVIGFGFLIGMVVVLAEPAVHVLNHQVEEVTGGTVTKRSMMLALSIGVGVSIGLSMIRIVCDFSVLYYLIPGYFISLALSLFVPKIYTAIAFDSGGVSSGPLTSSFILPMVIGVCSVIAGEDKILDLAFGVVAMVAMTPLITIQALGFRAIAARNMRERIVMKRILDADDEQIIYFDTKEK